MTKPKFCQRGHRSHSLDEPIEIIQYFGCWVRLPVGLLLECFDSFFFVCPVGGTRMNHETAAGIYYLLDTVSYSSDVVGCTYISVDCNFSLLLNVKA